MKFNKISNRTLLLSIVCICHIACSGPQKPEGCSIQSSIRHFTTILQDIDVVLHDWPKKVIVASEADTSNNQANWQELISETERIKVRMRTIEAPTELRTFSNEIDSLLAALMGELKTTANFAEAGNLAALRKVGENLVTTIVPRVRRVKAKLTELVSSHQVPLEDIVR